jgi:hypothetical protein
MAHRLRSHSTRAARPQSLSAALRGMRWQGTDTEGGRLRRPETHNATERNMIARWSWFRCRALTIPRQGSVYTGRAKIQMKEPCIRSHTGSARITIRRHQATTVQLRSRHIPDFRLRHSRINKSVPDQRRLSDFRRQPIAHLVHLRRDGGAEIVITTVVHHLGRSRPPMSAPQRITDSGRSSRHVANMPRPTDIHHLASAPKEGGSEL